MARIAFERSAKWVGRLRAPGFYSVGGVPGLALHVASENSRSWVLRATMPDGRRRDMGLGPYPEVSLKDAREAAREARASIRDGHDPIEEARARRRRREDPSDIVTFKHAAASYIALQEPAWRGRKSGTVWRASLETYVFPTIGDMPVAQITTAHIIKILADPTVAATEHFWVAKMETAQRTRGRLEAILDWAIAGGFRVGPNPARWKGHLELMLASPTQLRKQRPVKHHNAISVDDAPAFLRQLRQAGGMGARCLELVMLTAARSGEARGAEWKEIDLEHRIWTVPGERMKAGREHRVPLSRQAVALLRTLPRVPGSDLVFPSDRVGSKLSDMTLLAVMRRMGMSAVPHGLRSTFRVWAAERTDYPREIAEAALAHQIGDSVERAYLRTDHLAKRAAMMQDYADFLTIANRDAETDRT